MTTELKQAIEIIKVQDLSSSSSEDEEEKGNKFTSFGINNLKLSEKVQITFTSTPKESKSTSGTLCCFSNSSSIQVPKEFTGETAEFIKKWLNAEPGEISLPDTLAEFLKLEGQKERYKKYMHAFVLELNTFLSACINRKIPCPENLLQGEVSAKDLDKVFTRLIIHGTFDKAYFEVKKDNLPFLAAFLKRYCNQLIVGKIGKEFQETLSKTLNFLSQLMNVKYETIPTRAPMVCALVTIKKSELDSDAILERKESKKINTTPTNLSTTTTPNLETIQKKIYYDLSKLDQRQGDE